MDELVYENMNTKNIYICFRKRLKSEQHEIDNDTGKNSY